MSAPMPYKTQILRDGLFTFGDKIMHAEEVVARLERHLTPERIKRINDVLEHRTYSVATVAEGLYDIGNISAVMRSAESFGFMPFHIVERKEAQYKMSDRISKGSEKWLDIRKVTGPETCFANLRQEGYKIFATDLKASHKIREIDFTQKIALVFGNEKDGVSDYVRENSDGTFIWPMLGFAQSFNISVAAALCYGHAHRERVDKWGKSGDLSPQEKTILRAHYCLRTLDSAMQILSAK